MAIEELDARRSAKSAGADAAIREDQVTMTLPRLAKPRPTRTSSCAAEHGGPTAARNGTEEGVAEGVGCGLEEGMADAVTVGEVIAVGCVLTEAHAVATSATNAATTPNLALWDTTNLRLASALGAQSAPD
jgi:hypothetical protein